MGVPTSGTLSMQKLAREAKHGDYNGSQNMGTISMYDIMNGGQVNGSTIDYPTLNTGCEPNPAGTLSNPTEVTILSLSGTNGNSGGTYPNTLFQAWYEGTAGSGTIFYANPCGTETIDDINPIVEGTSVRYWICDSPTGSCSLSAASTPMGCDSDECVAFSLTSSSAVTSITCGCP
jgi:hypothetical protein|tara:strand:+ start:31 stop:558 length:528 start_codon:yes stop_codon:yes gene_type:complete